VLAVHEMEKEGSVEVSAVHEVTADKISREKLRAAQAIDQDIRSLLDKAREDSQFRKDKDGLAYMIGKAGQCRLVVPKCLRRYVLS